MSLEGVNGILNVESAALHAPQVGVANTNPQHILSVGSNLYVSGDSSDVLTVDGNVLCEGVKVGLIEVIPSYDFEAVTTVGNVTSNTLQFTNPDMGFVATGNATIGKTLTVSGFRITATAEANDDLAAITAAGADTSEAIHITNATNSTSPLTGALRLGTNTIFSGLGVSGNVHVGQSLVVDTDTLFVDSTTDRVGIGKTDPATPLDVDGTVTATTFVGALAADQITGTLAVASGGTGTTTSTGTGSVVRSIAPTFTGTTTFSGEVDVTGNMSYTKPASILVDSNVVTEYTGPHGRDGAAVLKKYPEIIFEEGKFDRNDTTNTYVQAGYTVTASSQQSTQQAWKAFDENNSGTPPAWLTVDPSYNGSTYLGSKNLGTATGGNSTTVPGEYIILQMPNKVKLKHFKLKERFGHSGSAGDRAPAAGKIYGSNDGTYWSEVNTFSGLTYTDDDDVFTTVNVNSSIAYNRFALVVTAINVSQDDWVGISDLRYYGYEEDPPAGDTSIDTTFTSIMNTPQTTGANVYVDGNLGETFTNRVTGPDATGTATSYDSTGKYWELTGALTSNVTLEANTFLEGDQPHAVSVWFNSSNLEANVSNTCVFSVSDQEKLDSVNLDLQSNTWHNLTYAYQGEGGSRVTYLDGRKVAEDQAEDTFGEYPPFAMTGYSQGGYVLSVDADHDGTNKIWKAFDGDDSPSSVWFSQPGSGDADSSYQAGYARGNPGQSVTDTNGTTHSGSWGKIEFPYKFVLNYVRVHGGTPISSYWPHNPDNYVILGSNDDTNWDLLTTRTGANDGTNGMTAGGTNIDQHPVNATKAYKYIKFLVTKLGSTSGDREFIIASLKLYGHRENDLVRLPDPTNVLKYPHIAMTGPAQRGYVAEQTNYSGFHTDGYSYRLFDDSDGQYQTASVYSSGVAGGSTPTTTATDSTAHQGVHITLTLPHKIQLQSVKFKSHTYYARTPASGTFLGSNNNSTWDVIGTFSGIETTSAGQIHTVNIANYASKSYYKYIRLVVTHTSYSVNSSATGGGGLLEFSRLEYYGTGVDSIPIQIGGGNIDKVANFRVYDKFVGEDQALEIWDAQKDEFGRAKSSATLHKGRLGIGTTEPEGMLAVADEPHNLEEFPPRPMTGYKTHFEGHGEFCVSASSDLTVSATEDYLGWEAFDKNLGSIWYPPNGAYNSGVYQGTDRLASETPTGSYLVLEMPYKIYPKRVEQYGRSNGAQLVGAAIYYAKANPGDPWTPIHYQTSSSSNNGTTPYIGVINSSVAYQYFAIVVTSSNPTGNDTPSISNLVFFGTREQGQSVLHDGQLTLTKNLTVPRIGPALDADDTPRRDRLVVEYNTSTNPTFDGAVRDTSGRGNDGVFYGGASYDATEKSLTSSGTTGEIRVGSLPTTTITQLSLSFWINPSGNAPIFYHGYEAIGRRISFSVDTSGTGLFFAISGNYIQNSACLTLGRWQHVSVVFLGGSIGASLSDGSAVYKLYIDGADKGWSGGLFNAGTLQLENGHPFVLMNGLAGTSGTGAIKLSNFKYYDTALTAQEVKTLYDMGRCDEGHHVVNFSKTRVGIGLGDGEAPQAALDVRGNISATGIIRSKRPMWSAGHQPGTSTVLPTMPSTTGIVFEDLNYDHTGNYSTSTGRFTVPVSGYYFIGTRALVYVPSDTARVDVDVAKVRINGTTTRVIQGERLAGTQGGRATSLNISVQISGTVYLVEGEQVYPRYQSTGTTTYVVTIDNDFNEFWGFLIEQV